MAAPTVVSVNPAAAETDVVLGTQLQVTFDQELDAETINESTFSLTGPGQTQIFTPDQMNAQEPDTITGREYITGTFDFALDGNGRTVVTFNPAKPLQKDTAYTVLLLGGSNLLGTDAIKNLAGEALAQSYEWSFKTGTLNVTEPPAPAPLPEAVRYIDASQIVVIPRKVVGNNLAQEIEIIFPEEIDPASVNIADVLVSIEPILGDLSVVVPANLSAFVDVEGRKIIVAVTGW